MLRSFVSQLDCFEIRSERLTLNLTVHCSKSLYSVFCIHSVFFHSCEIVQAAVTQEERASKNTHRDINDDYFAYLVVILLLLWSVCENLK